MFREIKYFRRPYQIICLNKNNDGLFFLRTKNLNENFYFIKNSKREKFVKKIKTPFKESFFVKYKLDSFFEIDQEGSGLLLRNFFGKVKKKIKFKRKNLKIQTCVYDNESNKLILIDSTTNTICAFDLKLKKLKSIKLNKKIILKNSCIEKFNEFFLISYDKNKIKLLDNKFKIVKDLSKKIDFRHIKSIKYNGRILAICDYLSHQIKLFNNKFNHIGNFGGKGSSKNRLDLPNHLDVYKNKFIISDLNNDRILELAPKSKAKILIKPQYINGDLRRPIKILKKSDNFFILDRDNNKLSVFNKKFKFVHNIKIKNFKNAKPNSFVFGEYKNKDCIVILYRFFNYKNKILIYNFSGKLISSKIVKTKDAQDINYLNKKYIIADTLNRRLNLYNDKFNLIKSKKITSFTKNNRVLLKFVEIDDKNFIYTSDFDKCIILKFDENLNFVTKLNFNKLKNKISVIRYAYFLGDNILIFSRNKYPIWIFNFKSKKFIRKIGRYRFLNKYFFLQNPTSLVFNDKNISVIDKENDRIVNFPKNF